MRSLAATSATCTSCSLCSCMQITSGASAATIFCSMAGFFSSSARKPATFHATAVNVVTAGTSSDGAWAGCVWRGAGVCGMWSGMTTFSALGFSAFLGFSVLGFFAGAAAASGSASAPAGPPAARFLATFAFGCFAGASVGLGSAAAASASAVPSWLLASPSLPATFFALGFFAGAGAASGTSSGAVGVTAEVRACPRVRVFGGILLVRSPMRGEREIGSHGGWRGKERGGERRRGKWG
mmetsp:Transcript_18288/g.45526  ORF Transcript_18288/g.45526 Transcript_18288/m.45526 type:complete len:239 (+) Transcript_18288:1155-1871(+)